jgi:type II secretory ATPase GspE/PulE/Tfp pilus assembly ATPase PilB-like protein
MTFSSGQSSNANETVFEPVFDVATVSPEQVFKLIEGLLPLEVCLHYQLLPLSLENQSLQLGMVDPTDEASLEYVNRMLAYQKCAIIPLPITLDQHRHLLSEFLKYSEAAKQPQPPSPQPKQAPQALSQETISQDETVVMSSAETVLVNSKGTGLTTDSSATVILEAVPGFNRSRATSPNATPVRPQSSNSTSKQAPQRPIAPNRSQPATYQQAPAANRPQSNWSNNGRTTIPPVLLIQATHAHQPLEELIWLHPKQLLQELLSRILSGGIGRLYLERGEYNHRIIVSQNGATQGSVEISSQGFQKLLNELKQMVGLSADPVQQPRTVDLDRLYQGESVLLRFRFMQGNYGEQATLQVLRGKASQFHENQRLAKLKQDTVTLVQQLQVKLHNIHALAEQDTIPGQDEHRQLEQLYDALNRLDQDLRQKFFSKREPSA